MLGGFAATYTGLAYLFLFKRHASAGHGKFFLDPVLTFLFTAPHSLNKSGLFGKYLSELVHIRR